MKPNLENLTEQFEKMPIYGKLRELDKRLTFGQYLTVLKEWWDDTRKMIAGFEKELGEMLKEIFGHEETTRQWNTI